MSDESDSIIARNFREIAVLGLGGYWAVTTGTISLPSVSLPDWWQLGAMALVGAGAVAFVGSSRLMSLLPDAEKIYLIELDGTDERGGAIWELTPETFSEMEVYNGILFPWSGATERAYEVREYDPERNVAVGNWRESRPDSELLSHNDVQRALDQLHDLKTNAEQAAQLGKEIQRNLPKLARELDAERAAAQAQTYEDHVAPDFGGRDIGDVLADVLPEDTLPDHMGDGERQAEAAEDGEIAGFEILEDGEALDPGELSNGVEP